MIQNKIYNKKKKKQRLKNMRIIQARQTFKLQNKKLFSKKQKKLTDPNDQLN